MTTIGSSENREPKSQAFIKCQLYTTKCFRDGLQEPRQKTKLSHLTTEMNHVRNEGNEHSKLSLPHYLTTVCCYLCNATVAVFRDGTRLLDVDTVRVFTPRELANAENPGFLFPP